MRHSILFVTLLGVACAAGAQSSRLLPAAEQDLVPSSIAAAPKRLAEATSERAPVSFSWALEAGAVVDAPRPYLAESREFWSVVDSNALKAGLRIDTTAPGALIRISPSDHSKRAALGIEGLRLRQDGREIGAVDAFAVSANAAQLKEAGADFGEGTIALRLDPELGAGRFELVASKAVGSYLVHVFEPDSPFALSLTANRVSLLTGGVLTVTASLQNAGTKQPIDAIAGELTSPAGERFELQFKRSAGGDYVASLQVPATAIGGIGLWEVHGFAGSKVAGLDVNRDARTSVAIGHATARLAGDYQFKSTGGLSFDLPVEVAAPGRYAIRATLFATDATGQLVPVAQSESAKWLDRSGVIGLAFEKTLIPVGMGAPFELRELQLKDQGRLADLERRALALRVETALH